MQLTQQIRVLPPLTKNETIKATLKATKERRQSQTCRTFEVKIDKSHLNTQSKEHLKLLFLEAKWLYNYILSHNRVFDMDYKLSAVPVKVKDTFEIRKLTHLSAQMKQSIVSRTMDNIRGLTRLKEKGRKIGALKFKSYVNAIPLKQYGNTYKILNEKYVRIQGISHKLRVNGLEQLPEGVEIANGSLLQKHGDYYITITTYQTWEQINPPLKTVGIMGDYRTYEYICAIRVVESLDAMTANFAKLDWELLEKIGTRIINEVKGINRVVYDISNKPPSTIEYE